MLVIVARTTRPGPGLIGGQGSTARTVAQPRTPISSNAHQIIRPGSQPLSSIQATGRRKTASRAFVSPTASTRLRRTFLQASVRRWL
jgi:hypothetical protein